MKGVQEAKIAKLEADIENLKVKRRREGVKSDLGEILKIAKEHHYLWEEGGPLHNEEMEFTGHFMAPDEYWYMAVHMGADGNFYFNEKGESEDLSVAKASASLIGGSYIGEPGDLLDNFKTNLANPLGKYLAQKELGHSAKRA